MRVARAAIVAFCVSFASSALWAADLKPPIPYWDTHLGSLFVQEFFGGDIAEVQDDVHGYRPWRLQFDIPSALQAGAQWVSFAIVTNPIWGGGPETTIAKIDAARAWIAEHAELVELAQSPDDVERIRKAGKLAVNFQVLGSHSIGSGEASALELVDELYDAGVRIFGLSFVTNNEYAASALSVEPNEPGLTPAGRSLVRRLNEQGIVIDLNISHAQSFSETLQLSSAPVLVSNAGVRSLVDRHRNLDDWQIKAIARKGGVIGVSLGAPWISQHIAPTIEDVVRHIRYIRDLVGVEHVALGSGLDTLVWLPRGMHSVRDLPKLADSLRQNGFSAEEIRAIFSGNIQRILRAAQSQRPDPSSQ